MGWQASEALVDAALMGGTAIAAGVGMAQAAGADPLVHARALGDRLAPTQEQRQEILDRLGSR